MAVSDGRSGPRESKLNRTDGFAKEGKRKKRKEKGEHQFCSEVVGERTEISGPEEGGALRKQRVCEGTEETYRSILFRKSGRGCFASRPRRFVAIVDSTPP